MLGAELGHLLEGLPMLSFRLRTVEKDFFVFNGGLAARGSEMSSSAGGVGRHGSAVMLLTDPAVDAAELWGVPGRVMRLRVLVLPIAPGFLMIEVIYVAGMLAIEGLLT